MRVNIVTRALASVMPRGASHLTLEQLGCVAHGDDVGDKLVHLVLAHGCARPARCSQTDLECGRTFECERC